MSIILPNLNHSFDSGFLIPDFPYAQYLRFPPVPRFFLYPLILQQDSLFWLFLIPEQVHAVKDLF